LVEEENPTGRLDFGGRRGQAGVGDFFLLGIQAKGTAEPASKRTSIRAGQGRRKRGRRRKRAGGNRHAEGGHLHGLTLFKTRKDHLKQSKKRIVAEIARG